MSKFCIDLEGMMMTDAIAAVVEAWLDAQNVEASSPQNTETYEPGDLFVETIQDAGSAVLQVLQEASDRGVSSISRGELVTEITRRFRFAPKTIDNTLTRMVGARKPDICRVSRPRGHYKLSPRFLALSPNRIPPNGYVIAARQHKQQRRQVG
jgi:hypothetical protein